MRVGGVALAECFPRHKKKKDSFESLRYISSDLPSRESLSQPHYVLTEPANSGGAATGRSDGL